MSVQPINFQVNLMQQTTAAQAQQQAQDQPVINQQYLAQQALVQGRMQASQVSQTRQTEGQRVEERPGGGRGQHGGSQRRRRESEASEEEVLQDPDRGRIIDVKR
jgi:hypothetical protein